MLVLIDVKRGGRALMGPMAGALRPYGPWALWALGQPPLPLEPHPMDALLTSPAMGSPGSKPGDGQHRADFAPVLFSPDNVQRVVAELALQPCTSFRAGR